MQRNVFFLLGVIIVILTGCTLAPKYTKPEASIPGAWPAGEAYVGTKAAVGAPIAMELRWREFFTDERLKKVIETALNNNRDLRTAVPTMARGAARHPGAERRSGSASNGVTTKQGNNKSVRSNDTMSTRASSPELISGASAV
jgi:multidrug efflux system outer membrane protein